VIRKYYVRSRLRAFTPSVPVRTRDGVLVRSGSTWTRPDSHPEDSDDKSAWSSAPTVDPECRARGWHVVCHDCNEAPTLEEFGEAMVAESYAISRKAATVSQGPGCPSDWIGARRDKSSRDIWVGGHYCGARYMPRAWRGGRLVDGRENTLGYAGPRLTTNPYEKSMVDHLRCRGTTGDIGFVISRSPVQVGSPAPKH
jgi:hypothetical protein